MEKEIICRQLVNQNEIAQAKELVKKIYVREGYVSSDENLSLSKFIDYKDSATFGALIEDTVFGTISVVIDNGDEHGLPMDSLYKEELIKFRNKNLVLAEVTQFAIDEELFKKMSLTFSFKSKLNTLALFSTVMEYSLSKKIDILCIAVNPKHATFYTMLGFETIGGQKYYESVKAPAVALFLDMKTILTKKTLVRLLGKGSFERLTGQIKE